MYATLDEIRQDVMRRLGNAANDRRSAMHAPVVATTDASVRVMVLREFNSSVWMLRFHTDSRAPKARFIGTEGDRTGVLFYDRKAKIQIRAQGIGRVECEGERADRAWEEATNFARRCYLGEGPGAVSEEATSGLPAEFEGVEPTAEQVAPARRNFAVLLVALDHLDWLYLAHDGHRRAQFDRSGMGEWEGRWVAP
ncbi:flavin-binding protein [Qipengyuania sp. JC766]|uniref:flavin-binding protein n=1 Tax=Qipengyuania sp. JC766 TaxID=3232139 RepID=UPI003457ED84